ncbi:5-oxoprolinase subunit PxpB [Spongiivirga citrea]|uniref:5-oxoprolinase subunit PxpB n=1 Tax=Spongiivirga citrea TaxID=1481457 RepID=A0A6M0CEX2_9FLAO|nr:5-oxoprolinase subunit PxpB [Spongiivirga citrea]NER16378.1 5-oxoprolinase subunit PxpB [Spongiivirga citrea]
MGKFNLTFSPYGDRGILIEWPAEISDTILHDRLFFENCIQSYYIKQKIEIISAYNSLLVIYKSTINNLYSVKKQLLALYDEQSSDFIQTKIRWTIPVCYEEEFGTDLADLSANLKLSKQAVIHKHSKPIYAVHFIGFLPGFLYLGGLNEELHLARKSTPSLSVRKGSVAIGGSQTGIYPINSPGGWHIIGNSPVNWFNVTNENPCFASSGDEIKFQPITKSAYNEILERISLNEYQLEKEIIND